MERTRSSKMIAFALAAVLCWSAAGCRGESQARGAAQESDIRTVRAAAAESGVLPEIVAVSGTLAAEERAELGMKAAGRIGRLHVDLGSVVRSGQPLASLDPTDFDLGVRQAEAALQQARARLGLGLDDDNDDVELEDTAIVRQARATLDEARLRRERFARLFDETLVSQSERDAAEAAFLVADGRYQDALEEARNRRAVLAQRRSELALARQRRADTVLQAPFDGAVAERHVAIGQYVSPGQAVVTLVRVDPLRLRVEVPEREAARVRAGQEVRVRVEGDSSVYRGQVARLSPAIDERSRTLTVEAAVPNREGALRPGSFARAEIVTAWDRPVVLVPASAITTFAGLDKVLLVRDGKSEEKRVVLGRRAGNRVEVVEGVAAGDLVVLEPGNLVGGRPVRVEN